MAGPPLNEEPLRSIPRALVIDEAGRVWGAGNYGALFHYDPDSEEIVHHPNLRLSSELGREFKTILDAMVRGPEGVLYGAHRTSTLQRNAGSASLRMTGWRDMARASIPR